MAITPDYTTHTLLNGWQRRMQVPVWAFNQIAGAGTDAPIAEPGKGVFVQPERDSIAEGIISALSLVGPYLRYDHIPVYRSWTMPLGTYQGHRRHKAVDLPYGYIQAVGRRGTELLEADALVVYSDEDGDGVDDTATITINLTDPVDPDEVQLFFRVADGAYDVANERWRIEPARATISGLTLTIIAHRALFVRPAIWEQPYIGPNYRGQDKNVVNTNDPTAFVTLVDVYRIYPDATNAIVFRSQRGSCSCTEYQAAGEAIIQDAVRGTLLLCPPACACHWWDSVDVHVYAGRPLTNGQPERSVETAILRLSNTLQPYEVNNMAEYGFASWRDDNLVETVDPRRPLDKETPFGYKVGAVAAWRTVVREGLRGLVAGGAL